MRIPVSRPRAGLKPLSKNPVFTGRFAVDGTVKFWMIMAAEAGVIDSRPTSKAPPSRCGDSRRKTRVLSITEAYATAAFGETQLTSKVKNILYLAT